MDELNGLKEEILSYYENTSLDYGEWSKSYNMHFGYYRFPMNPFSREKMLEEMNHQVFKHLHLNDTDQLVYDLGCGLAATCRSFAKQFPHKKIKGVTLVPWQIKKANELNKSKNFNSSIELIHSDYTKLNIEDNSADGVYALESACHCPDLDKSAVVKEILRILKPGKRFVIVDGFIKRHPDKFNRLLKYCYNTICKGWALPSFPHLNLLINALKNYGGSEIEVKDFSYRVAPTAIHAPFTVIYFLIKKRLQGEKLNPIRIAHLKACVLGLLLGIHRSSFSYCLITGIKKP